MHRLRSPRSSRYGQQGSAGVSKERGSKRRQIPWGVQYDAPTRCTSPTPVAANSETSGHQCPFSTSGRARCLPGWEAPINLTSSSRTSFHSRFMACVQPSLRARRRVKSVMRACKTRAQYDASTADCPGMRQPYERWACRPIRRRPTRASPTSKHYRHPTHPLCSPTSSPGPAPPIAAVVATASNQWPRRI